MQVKSVKIFSANSDTIKAQSMANSRIHMKNPCFICMCSKLLIRKRIETGLQLIAEETDKQVVAGGLLNNGWDWFYFWMIDVVDVSLGL